MLKHTLPSLRQRTDVGGVIGTEVPSFAKFPYKAQEVLQLYRAFWRLILRYPANERQDLIFRLRNEFRSKRNLGHQRMIHNAVVRGQSLLEMYKSKIEYSESRRLGMMSRNNGSSSSNNNSNSRFKGGAQSVDGAWDQVQFTTKSVIPGLRNSRVSRPIAGRPTMLSQRTASVVPGRR